MVWQHDVHFNIDFHSNRSSSTVEHFENHHAAKLVPVATRILVMLQMSGKEGSFILHEEMIATN